MFGINWRGVEDQRNLITRLLQLPKDDPLTFWWLFGIAVYYTALYALMLARYA